jgi:hypothetical protein
VELDLDQRLSALLVYLATSGHDAHAIRTALETETDPSETIARILHEGRKNLAPAMMPGYRRAGRSDVKRRLKAAP